MVTAAEFCGAVGCACRTCVDGDGELALERDGEGEELDGVGMNDILLGTAEDIANEALGSNAC